MGQTIGKAPLVSEELGKLANLPRSSVAELWEAFNDVAEGFGLTQAEYVDILRPAVKAYAGLAEQALESLAGRAFEIMDDDHNGLVDALEAIITLALMSAMTPEEKVRFAFSIYDFDETGELSVDEVALLLRSAVSGICKFAGVDPPLESEIESVAVSVFEENLHEEPRIDPESFYSFCRQSPEIMSWMDYSSQVPDMCTHTAEYQDTKALKIAKREATPLFRGIFHTAALDTFTGLDIARSIADNGPREEVEPLRPWQQTVAFLEPTKQIAQPPLSSPAASLRLGWAYGFNTYSMRGSVRVSSAGALIFPSGTQAVVQSEGRGGKRVSAVENDSTAPKIPRSQHFFGRHTDVVSCVTSHISPDGRKTLVASGQAGENPCIFVWYAESAEQLAILRGRHHKGISCLAFSRGEGDLLLAVGADKHHSLAVYQWANQTVLYSAFGGSSPILGACFNKVGTFATCGEGGVTFWARQGSGGKSGRYSPEMGVSGRQGDVQTHLCCAESGSYIVSGAASGHLYIWDGRTCIRSTKAHSGAILTMVAGEGGSLVTGSADGKIQMWTKDLEVGASFSVSALGSRSEVVHSLYWDETRHRILAALSSGETFEISDTDGHSLQKEPLICGHSGLGVSGLATHPLDPHRFATAGADATLRIWHSGDHKHLRICSTSAPATSVAYSPDGHMICVGLGGGRVRDEGEGDWCKPSTTKHASRKIGAWIIFKGDDLTLVHEARDSKESIRAVAWSPDGGTLGVASEDRCIYLYSSGDWVAKAKCSGFSGGVNHFDFSKDGSFIRATSFKSGELLFFGADLGDQQTPSSMRDVEWATDSCTFSREGRGAWSLHADASVITASAISHTREEIACGDHFGRLKLIRYPSLEPGADVIDAKGHGPPVRGTAWAADDRSIISVSGGDCSVFQWDYERQEAIGRDDALRLGAEERELYKNDLGIPVIGEGFSKACSFDTSAVSRMELTGEEEAFAPVRPWHRAITQPTGDKAPPVDDSRPADSNLLLDWVHGYRSKDCRGGVQYTSNGTIVFFAGTIAVVMNSKSKPPTQRFYEGHTSDILSLALHPDEKYAATGELSTRGGVHIWHLESMTRIAAVEGYHRGGVTSVSFSTCGRLLVSAGTSAGPQGYSLAVHDWKNNVVIAGNRRGVGGRTLDIGFLPDSKGLVQVGDGFIRFWDISSAGMSFKDGDLRHTRGVGHKQPFYCLAWDGSSPVVGTHDGRLYSFIGNKLTADVQAHDGPVWALASAKEGLVSGGKDGFVKVWSHGLHPKYTVNLCERLSSSVDPSIRSISWDSARDRIVIGTAGSEIMEVSAIDGANINKDPVINRCHGRGELWALAANPCAPEYATAGDDGMIQIWDIYSHSCIRAADLNSPCRAIAYSPDGRRLLVGLGMPVRASATQFDGKWLILDAHELEVLFDARDSQKHITAATFSPDGMALALASADAKIYVYDCSKSTYSLTAVITAHNSPIMACDFSADGRYLRSTCAASELFYFEADTGMVIPAPSRLKNTKWATHTVHFSWATQGIWPAAADQTEITSADAALSGGVDSAEGCIAAGDTFGRVKLVRYPSATAYATVEIHAGHGSGGTANLRWTQGSSHLVSIGTKGTILQWRHDRDDVGSYESTKDAAVSATQECEAQALGLNGLDGDRLDPTQGIQFPADLTRQWINTAIEPSYSAELMAAEEPFTPDLSLGVCKLISAHGLWQQGSARNNLGINLQGELVRPASHLAVVYHRKTNTQRCFEGHSDPVSCLTSSLCGRFVATGEASARPTICIWDSASCSEIIRLPAVHCQGVIQAQFSADARCLASIGADSAHSLAVWSSQGGEWNDVQLEALTASGRDSAAFVCFCPPGSDFTLCTGGAGPLLFWTLRGRTLAPRRATYGRMGTPQTMISGAAVWSSSNPMRARLVTGAISGHMYVWKGRGLDRTIRAHESELHAIHGSQAGVVTGGSDGCIKFWSNELSLVATFDLSLAPVPPLVPRLRSVCSRIDEEGTRIVGAAAATAGGEVYELTMRGGPESALLTSEGHYKGYLCGLATHPTNHDLYATAGDDGTIRIWSVSLGHVVRKGLVGSGVRCISWSPDGSLILLGLGGDGVKDGGYAILNGQTLEPSLCGRDARTPATACSFDPTGDYFALGCEDCTIYIYKSSSSELIARAEKHSSPPIAIDFSKDSNYIQSSDTEGHLLYHSVADGSPMTVVAQIKHIRWASWTSPIGWPLQAVWPPASSQNAVNIRSSHLNPCRNLLAVGDSEGKVRVYRYPAVGDLSRTHVLLGSHAGPVGLVRWTCDGSHAISIGRSDRTIRVHHVGEEEKVSKEEESETGKRQSASGSFATKRVSSLYPAGSATAAARAAAAESAAAASAVPSIGG